MAEQLKEMFNTIFYQQLAKEVKQVYAPFHADKFLKEVTENIQELSLNQRLRNTSIHLKQHLPNDFKKSLDILFEVIPNMQSGYTTLVFPDYVGLYGHTDFELSMNALKHFTCFGSSEFAIREFLKRDFDKTIKVMTKWSQDENQHVRRLASEGSRPRLPWSFKLEEVIKHPNKTLSILENLKEDKELYVKKSVANHLNDISKDNTEWMIEVLKGWSNENSDTQWIKKHASRNLIKQGNSASLALFDFEKNSKVKIENFKLKNNKIQLGENLQFEFSLVSDKNKSQKLALDFIIHYVKKSNALSPKVFKLKELELPPHKKVHIKKQHALKDFTTRKHYSGKHLLEIIVNGNTVYETAFELNV